MRLGFTPQNHVCLNGKKYTVDLSFRKVMRTMALLKDSGISEKVRVGMGVKILLSPPSHTRARLLAHPQKLALLNKIFELLGTDSKSKQNTKPVISLEKDGALIYGAFLQTYGINLNKGNLDWREFCVLLSCIPENTALFSVMQARTGETFESMNDGLEALLNKLIGGEC